MRGRPLCAFCLVFLLFQIVFIRGFRIGKDWNPSLLEQSVKAGSVITVSGRVYHTELKKETLAVYLTAASYQTKIIVYIKQVNSEHRQLHIGNEIKVTGEVAYFDAPRNPGNFDQKFYYQKQGIHGCIRASSYVITDEYQNRWKDALSQLRIRWKRILTEVLGEENGNTMSAILLGDKSELDRDLKELYQKNGIGHILAISGLHMTFIGLGFYKLLRKWGLSFVSAGMIGIVFLISYTMMIGNGVASMRALVMFIVRIGADMTGRVYDMLTSLALAAMVILIWRPLYLYDAGFLLSFGAILGILLAGPVFREWTSSDTKKECKNKKGANSWILKLRKTLCEGLWGSISIQLAILPCMLYFYFEVPPYSILINLLVIPLMSVVLGAGVTGSVIYSLVPVIGSSVLWICKPVLALYELLCDFCIRLPGSHLVTGQPGLWQIVVYYAVLGIALAVLYRKRSGYVVLLLSVNILLLGVRWNDLSVYQKNISVTMLDVGQGDGLVVKGNRGLVCMIDGGSSDVAEVGKYRIEPYLKSQGIGTVDYAFISHGDSDHYSGIEEMLKRQRIGVRIRYLVLPGPSVQDEKLKALAKEAAENGVKVVTIQEGESVCDDAGHQDGTHMKLTCVAPAEDYAGEIGNASSMVLSLSYGEFHMLFTGDVEGVGETALTERLNQFQAAADGEMNVKYEVLKVAHHGSKNSSTQEFLEAVKPRIALISAGRNNRYGHPHEETVKKLMDMGCRIKSTQDQGAVRIVTDGN
ncbi:MAG: DNA internalization-related competence protein ComEC/Rec2 [Hespellia sp.]|nr:DNA internalization-related competence protein ComEC/Rec2 [Hespellia sp.]